MEKLWSQSRAFVRRAAGAGCTVVLSLLATSAPIVACGVGDGDAEDVDPSADEQRLSSGEYALFADTSRPTVSSASDSSAVEVGVRFKADSDGQVTSVRFYKGTGNTGTHDAHVWSSTGTLLATQRFTSETRRGWQTVRLATPVAIKAGASYVVSYHTDTGHYAGDNGYFAAKGVDNGPLHAPADTASAHNGVYRYGASAFPSDSYAASNYWVDVIFKPGSGQGGGGSDGPPPGDAGAPPPSPPPPPSSSAWPDATNTGVPKGIVLKPSGGITVNTAGTVLDGYAFTGAVIINANNVTLQNCTVTTADYWAVKIMDGITGTVVQDCTIDNLSSGNQGIRGGGRFLRNNIMRCSDGIDVVGNDTLIQDNYIHDMSGTADSHFDTIQADGNFSNLVIRHNTLVNEHEQTSVIMLSDWWGPLDGAIVDNNRLLGGGYTVYVAGNHGHGTTGVKITNNRMKKGGFGFLATYAPIDLTMSGNVDDATGAPINF